ncbi:TonB-dependent receptor [Compostibacter hankyongensis]|uniref:TonB-dependent receptor n=1 Tax=Compostibacter hankyongensis TaxID=1007089 RepID=A0ABP8FK28_9BACT
MKLTIALLLVACVETSAAGYAQSISFSRKHASFEEIFREIRKQTGYDFLYNSPMLKRTKLINVAFDHTPLSKALNEMFSNQPLTYTIIGKTIVVKERGQSPPSAQKNLLPPVNIQGTVVDSASGKPLSGVTVQVKEGTAGATSDEHGRFELSVPDNAVLIISYLGYNKKEIPVSGRSVINISLSSSATGLSQVVVVGYGTQSKATMTGAVVSTEGDNIRQSPATNLSNSLVGRLPGLSGVTRSGEPGSDETSLLIRGSNTLGDNTPLIVVDGIPNRDFSRINPADIESITVLKDASAAIYGARAANGVILVTTKRGKLGKPQISVNLNAGFQQPTVVPAMANAGQYVTMLNEIAYYRNESLGRYQVYSKDDIQAYKDGSDPWGHPNTDWFDAVFKPWSSQNYENVSISGGTENIKYFLSLGVHNQDGVYKNSGTKYSEYNFRSNIDGKISKDISVSLDFAGSQENRDYAVKGVGSIFRSIFRGKPNSSAYWPNGTPGPSHLEFGDQPAVTSTKATGYNLDKWYRLQTNGKINIIIPWVEGLSIQGNIAVDKTIRNQKIFQKPWYLYTWDGNPDHKTVPGKVGLEAPDLTQSLSDGQQITLNSYATYEHTIGQRHNVKFMAGVERQTGETGNFSAHRQNFISAAIDELFAGAADQYMTNTGNASDVARLTYFGRVNYDYSHKYLLEFVWRDDGSYIFPKDKRFGFFPGVSGGWRISEEKFWKDNIKVINDLKLRASWGQTGNDRIVPFQYLSTYGFSGNYVYNVNDIAPMLNELRIPNPNVTWEVANQSGVGIDAALLDNKVIVNLDYFYNIRSQILWQRNASVPTSTGLTLPPENIGKVSNRGWEATVRYMNQAGDFKYDISASGSKVKNKILFWDETPGVPEYQKSTGRPMGSALYYVSMGVFKDQAEVDKYPHWSGARPGDVIFKDVNNDGKIDGLDMVRDTKNDLPTFTGSFNVSLQYKQFDLSLLVQGAAGSQKYITIEGGETGNYYKLWADNRWTPEHPSSTYARAWDYKDPYWDVQPNTYWLYPSDYIRLKNIELGYSLPEKINSKINIEGLRIYINSLNPFTISDLTRKKLMDPEALNNYSYPLQRVINMGLTLTF